MYYDIYYVLTRIHNPNTNIKAWKYNINYNKV